MTIEVHTVDDPAAAVDRAGAHLAAEPVRHNLVATLLHRWSAERGAGRCWVAREADAVVGLGFRRPVSRPIVLTPMRTEVATAVADAVVDTAEPCAGVDGEVSAAAAFAGRWTERAGAGARPAESRRLYAVDRVTAAPVRGTARTATREDAALLAGWTAAFAREVGETPDTDPLALVVGRIAAGELFVWEDDGPVAFLGCTAPTNGAVRIGPVFTPPAQRGRGYATGLTASCSAVVRAAGHACLLYADLANPTANRVYRAIGYRAVAETLRYEFVTRARVEESLTRS